jgi:predicted heme/steroid binding protein
MKTIFMVLLALVLVACADETTEAVTPPVMEMPAPTEPAADPVVEPEPEMAPEPDPVDEEPEPEPDPVPIEEEPVDEEPEEEAELEVFTKESLAAFNGLNGSRAYVAVDGVVYDVTDSPRWRNGNHNGIQAGQDLTLTFNQQHGDNRLSSFPIVGRYEG